MCVLALLVLQGMTMSNLVVQTISQAPTKWYVQGNWSSNVQRPIVVVGPDSGPMPGQRIVYLSEFFNHHGGLVEEFLAWQKATQHAQKKETRRFHGDLQKEVKESILFGRP